MQLQAVKEHDQEILATGKCNVSALAKKYNVQRPTIYDWIKKRDKLVNSVDDTLVKTRVSRKIGRNAKSKYQELNNVMFQWVLEQNKKGLVVKVL